MADTQSPRAVIVTALVATTILARVAVLWILPPAAYSLDVHGWMHVADMLSRGQNPYTSGLLNWPPAWMQIIYVLAKVQRVVGVRFVTVLRSFLILIDVVNLLLALRVAHMMSIRRPIRVLLFGIALNPVLILLTCVHGNFDALAVASMLCCAMALIRYRDKKDPINWLLACFALGIAVLIKTFPLCVAPILMLRTSRLPRRTRAFGAALTLAPTALAMSVIYVLVPRDVLLNVIRYRSAAGSFGITGILALLSLPALSTWYQSVFAALLLVALAWCGFWMRRVADIEPRGIVLLFGMMCSALIVFGTGYGPQYIAWPLTFLVLSSSCFGDRWRRDLLVLGSVAAATYLIEYAFLPYLGSFLAQPNASAAAWRISDTLNDPGVVTLLQLPLFAGFLWVVFAGRAALRPAVREVAGVRSRVWARVSSRQERWRVAGEQLRSRRR